MAACQVILSGWLLGTAGFDVDPFDPKPPAASHSLFSDMPFFPDN